MVLIFPMVSYMIPFSVSLRAFDPSNLDDDDVMFFREFVTPPEEDLPNVYPLEEGLHTSNQSRDSRKTVTQPKNFKAHGLQSFFG